MRKWSSSSGGRRSGSTTSAKSTEHTLPPISGRTRPQASSPNRIFGTPGLLLERPTLEPQPRGWGRTCSLVASSLRSRPEEEARSRSSHTKSSLRQQGQASNSLPADARGAVGIAEESTACWQVEASGRPGQARGFHDLACVQARKQQSINHQAVLHCTAAVTLCLKERSYYKQER